MTAREVLETARGTANRGATHIFLGHPLSDGADKTTVEPGNTYSPGVWSCGISVWLDRDRRLYTPDLLEDDAIFWQLDETRPSLVTACYGAGPGVQVRHRLCHLGGAGTEGVDFNEVQIEATTATVVSLHIVVKDVGPAGGRLDALAWESDKSTLVINGQQRLVLEQAGVRCAVFEADAQHESAAAVLSLDLRLGAGDSECVGFKTEHGYKAKGFESGIPRRRAWSQIGVADAFRENAVSWDRALPARVLAPDPRIARTWERCAFHIMAAMECGLPRIGAVTYPVFWIRDGVIVLRALDLMGRHDLARLGNDHLAPLYFGGGFGAESDAPGEGIWALVRHARLSGDHEWLASMFPFIRARVAYLERMLTATDPIRAIAENRDTRTLNTAMGNILCLPAQNGLIHGRMDGHSPDFYINAWAYAGLSLAAYAARQLGETALAEQWTEQARDVDERIAEHLLPKYGNARDPIVAPYPSGALSQHRDRLRGLFGVWYRKNRLADQNARRPEALWTYFEAAQIHNALRLGFKDEAWVNLDGMLEPAGAWDVSAFIEGKPGGAETLPFRNDLGRRGWLHPERAEGSNMPHNWTGAEMVNLIRDIFVREDGDMLVLGEGVPDSWLVPGATFGVRDMPTDLGTLSYTATVNEQGMPELDYDGPEQMRTAFSQGG